MAQRIIQISFDLIKNSFFTFFSKKVKPKNFKYYSMCLFNKQLLYKLEVFERGLEKTWVRDPFVKSFLQVLLLNKSTLNCDRAKVFWKFEIRQCGDALPEWLSPFYKKGFKKSAMQFSNRTLLKPFDSKLPDVSCFNEVRLWL